ncbi:hypothetical protein [Rhizobium sp. RCC_161_2]|uniref:hypothetical protein n=1 Tax=Rhizobium sp. RCC_161_2 TaxID=3239219 RepID=UPI0035267920
MRRLFGFVFVLCIALPAHAQQVVDGSDKNLDQGVIKSIFSSLRSVVADPFSAQIADLKQAKNRPELYCGLINLKNGFGAYTGFQAFGYNSQYSNILLGQNLSDCMQ